MGATPLGVRMLNLVVLDNILFRQNLHREHLPLDMLNQDHLRHLYTYNLSMSDIAVYSDDALVQSCMVK